MGQLMVITTPALAPGFQLAGVETFAVDSPEQAEAILRPLLAGDKASLVVVHRGWLQAMPPLLKRQIEMSYRPVVIDIPDVTPTLPQETRRHQLAKLMRRIVGFQITFTAE
jgi:vacuolar-type H+-ATPase subunit F/Vma7